MRATLKALAGLFLVLLTSACLVETETTLGDPDPAMTDDRLVGVWYYAKDSEASIVAIAPDEEKKGLYRIAFVSANATGIGNIEGVRFEGWITVVNGKRYLHLRKTAGDLPDMPKLTIVAYDIGEGGLGMRFMNTKPVIAAIEAGKLKGRFKKGTYVDEVTITSPRAEFVAFMAGADDEKLFHKAEGALKKLPPTAK
jgi:hypothetical protein